MKLSNLIQTTAIALGLTTAAALPSFATDCTSESTFPEISHQELTDLIAKKQVFVVDVNGKDSFAKNHVTGAIHYDSHRADFAAQLPKDKNETVVAYCGGPKCTAWKRAAEEACKLGYTHVRHYKDGLQGWIKKTS